MQPQAYIKKLAPMLGIEEAELIKFDRYIADAGLRQKAKGRSYPTLTVKEALRLPLAVMVARAPSRAVSDLIEVEKFRFMVHGVNSTKGDAAALPQLIGASLSQIEQLPLIDVLALLAIHLADGGDCEVSLTVHIGGLVIIEIEDDAFTGEIQFTGAMDLVPFSDMWRTATIGRTTLEFIGKNFHPEVQVNA